MRSLCSLLPLLLSGCFFFGGQAPTPTPVYEPDVLEFADRIQGFYGALEGVSLDTLMTYEDGRLRTFFGSERDFSDYYAALASAVREATFRNARAKGIEIVEFRFDQSDAARVDVVLRGDHARGLLFWDTVLIRTDTWRRVGGEWVLKPEQL
jgi:hypothetical protein